MNLSFFNGISTLFRLFYAKAILLEEQYWYYLTHSWEDKGAHTFPKGICPKVNVIARLEYELAYYDSAVQRFNHYTTRTPLSSWRILFYVIRFNDISILDGYLMPNSVCSYRQSRCNEYRRRTRRSGSKSWTKLFAFHIALIPFGKEWI